MSVQPAAGAGVDTVPAVDRVLALPTLTALSATHGRTPVVAAIREVLAELRQAALAGTLAAGATESEVLVRMVQARVEAMGRSRLRKVHNLTGTVLHTNFGRAILPPAAVDALLASQRGPVALEFDLETGRRGERDSVIASLLRELCGSESATVVNNCAAALLLALGALARRREVIVSRGELIEIGGSFRLPDLMRAAGVRLVEVGTTNRTHLADYAEAIGNRTALILKVHPSNYVISGFTSGVDVAPLAALAHERHVPLVVDLGSGALVDIAKYGLPAEPVVRDTVACGADLVLFSGDKLLGGPQAGLVAGRAALIARLNRDPLKRALRPGKLALAALEAVLGLYRAPELLPERLTTLRHLCRPTSAVYEAAQRLLPRVAHALAPRYAVTVEAVDSQIGSGAQPGATLASYALAVRSLGRREATINMLVRRLRALPCPVIGRVADDRLFLDLRCLEVADEADLCAEIGQLQA